MNMFSSVKFDIIVAINWLHNDWKYEHAVSREKTDKPDDKMYINVAARLDLLLKPDGKFIFDYRRSHGTKGFRLLTGSLNDIGLFEIERLGLPPNQIFIYSYIKD